MSNTSDATTDPVEPASQDHCWFLILYNVGCLRAYDFWENLCQTSNPRLKVLVVVSLRRFVGIFAPRNFHLVFFGRPRGRFFLDRKRW